MQENKIRNTYEDCSYFEAEDITPYHGDVFGHPNYAYFCTKNGIKKEIKFPYIQCKKMLKQETGLVIEGILYLYRKSDGFLTIKVTNVRRQIHHFLP